VCSTGPVAGVSVSAGDITVSGGTSPITMPGSKYGYQYTSTLGPIFSSGDVVRVAASGATAPPFTATVTIPQSLSVTSPAAAYGTVTMSRTSDVTIAWTGGGTDNVQVELDQYAPQAITIVCAFPASAGSGTIPLAAVSNLALATVPLSLQEPTTFLAVAALNESIVTAAGWSITVAARAYGLDAPVSVTP
jgi:hypothetical protein